MTERITLTVTLDCQPGRSADALAAYIEGVFDYLNATATVVRPPEADPLHPKHSEGEGQ